MKLLANSRITNCVILVVASTLAAVSARDYAGCWNDGSRLATVECLVDYHTLAIDRSIFVQVPLDGPLPYPKDAEELLQNGTGDKLFIDGRFYSDKSPVPALLLAGVYQFWHWCTGGTAREHPNTFCYVMTLASSGLAYVVSVWCVFQLAKVLALPALFQFIVTVSFALSTVALTYARHVNNHELLLGVSAALFLQLARATTENKYPVSRLMLLGTLTGFGYTIDLGAGPVLVAGVTGIVAFRCRTIRPIAVFALSALPWFCLHHAVNYAAGGTLKPANAVPEYFLWPGCTFSPQNLTGVWNHTFAHFFEYAAALLAGKRGFWLHNLPLLLLLPAIAHLFRGRTKELPEILFAGFWCGGTWLAYALTSNNYSGQCCTIRWFVPLLAPSYYLLTLFLRDHSEFRSDFVWLSAAGCLLGVFMWQQGPWARRVMPYAWFWTLQAGVLIGWFWIAKTKRMCRSIRVSSAHETTAQSRAA